MGLGLANISQSTNVLAHHQNLKFSRTLPSVSLRKIRKYIYDFFGAISDA